MAGTKLGALRAAATKAGITVGEYIARIDAGLLRCSWCMDWKSPAAFSPRPAHQPRGRDPYCLVCRRERDAIKRPTRAA
jgi:hypothetical protein